MVFSARNRMAMLDIVYHPDDLDLDIDPADGLG
jgi:hypothetical protein